MSKPVLIADGWQSGSSQKGCGQHSVVRLEEVAPITKARLMPVPDTQWMILWLTSQVVRHRCNNSAEASTVRGTPSIHDGVMNSPTEPYMECGRTQAHRSLKDPAPTRTNALNVSALFASFILTNLNVPRYHMQTLRGNVAFVSGTR